MLFGDLTAQATISGRRPYASVSGRIPIENDVAPAPPRRPPRFAGMRPAAIAACHRYDSLRDTSIININEGAE